MRCPAVMDVNQSRESRTEPSGTGHNNVCLDPVAVSVVEALGFWSPIIVMGMKPTGSRRISVGSARSVIPDSDSGMYGKAAA